MWSSLDGSVLPRVISTENWLLVNLPEEKVRKLKGKDVGRKHKVTSPKRGLRSMAKVSPLGSGFMTTLMKVLSPARG